MVTEIELHNLSCLLIGDGNPHYSSCRVVDERKINSNHTRLKFIQSYIHIIIQTCGNCLNRCKTRNELLDHNSFLGNCMCIPAKKLSSSVKQATLTENINRNIFICCKTMEDMLFTILPVGQQ